MQRGAVGEGDGRQYEELALQPRERTSLLRCVGVLAVSAWARAGPQFPLQGGFSLSGCHSELHLRGGGETLGVLAHIWVGPGKLDGKLLKSIALGDLFADGVLNIGFVVRCGGVCALPNNIHFNRVGRSGERGASWTLEASGLACG